MPKINSNNCELYYEERGDGLPVILVAGFVADHFVWATIIDELAKYYRVICLDNRGIGRSDAPGDQCSIEIMADDVVQLCKELDIDSVYLLSHSMGGCIVQDIMRRYRDLVRAAVISNSFSQIDIRFALYARMRLAMMQAEMAPEEIYVGSLGWSYSSAFLQHEGLVAAVREKIINNPHPVTIDGYTGQLNTLLSFNSSSWIKEIRSHCLIVGSELDMIVTQEQFKFLADNIADASFYLFKDAAHVPHIEKPQEFCKLVFDYFKRV